MFVRVRMDIGAAARRRCSSPRPPSAPTRAASYLYVVDDDNKTVYTRVEAGQRKDGLIAVKAAKGYPA